MIKQSEPSAGEIRMVLVMEGGLHDGEGHGWIDLRVTWENIQGSLMRPGLQGLGQLVGLQ